jgi:branched-chain amino acid transport system ATP-binding protein
MGISQVPEGRRIFPYLTVSENIDMGAFLRTDSAEIKPTKNMFILFFPFYPNEDARPEVLSVEVSSKCWPSHGHLWPGPGCCSLTNPHWVLHQLVVKRIFDIIKQINKENNTTIFLVEQNANMALKVAHRGYVMENGIISLSDTAQNLMKNEEVRKAYLGI